MNTAQATAIVQTVAAETGVTLDEILGDTRHAPIARARRQAYLALWEACGSYSLTARMMQRDHSTVMHGIRVAKAGGA